MGTKHRPSIILLPRVIRRAPFTCGDAKQCHYDVGNATLTIHPPTILHNCYTLECNLWDFNRFGLVCKILIDLNEILRAGKLIMYYKDSSLP